MHTPWIWRLRLSNSVEHTYVQELLEREELPTNTLLCGYAGFVGHAFWKSLIDSGTHFFVRVEANVRLLSEEADTVRKQNVIQHKGAEPRKKTALLEAGETLTYWKRIPMACCKNLGTRKWSSIETRQTNDPDTDLRSSITSHSILRS